MKRKETKRKKKKKKNVNVWWLNGDLVARYACRSRQRYSFRSLEVTPYKAALNKKQKKKTKRKETIGKWNRVHFIRTAVFPGSLHKIGWHLLPKKLVSAECSKFVWQAVVRLLESLSVKIRRRYFRHLYFRSRFNLRLGSSSAVTSVLSGRSFESHQRACVFLNLYFWSTHTHHFSDI